MKGEIRIYGCGGLGINAVATFVKGFDRESKVFPAFIDTSESNLQKFGDVSENLSLFEGMDGSGKIRRENAGAIAESMKKIMLKHKPTALNIVVFSASGGSGSVIGPLLLKELLKDDHTTIALIVGSEESIITTSNTQNTLKSLNAVSDQLKRPISIFYRKNDKDNTRTQVDNELQYALGWLTVLGSEGTDGLDTRDIANWLRFDKSSTMAPCLSFMDILDSNDLNWDAFKPISVASIFEDRDREALPVIPDYHCHGYRTLPGDGVNEVHFIVDLEIMSKIFKDVSTTLAAMEKERDSRLQPVSFLTENDKVDDTGLVL